MRVTEAVASVRQVSVPGSYTSASLVASGAASFLPEPPRRSADLPGTRPGEESLDAGVTPPCLRQPGRDQHPAVAKVDQAGIPAPVLHRSMPHPLFGGGIKHHSVRPAGETRAWMSEHQGASR